MYFIATGRQPYANCAHNEILALNICNGNRPEINEQEAPKCYIDLMKKCWDSHPYNRPNAIEIHNLITTFRYNKELFNEAEEYREANLSSFVETNQSITHPQAVYTSRLLNPYTKDLSNDNNINNSVEVIDATK